MNVSFNGYNENMTTFEVADGVKANTPVMVFDNGKVKAANGVFCGVCRGVKNGYAVVQLNGYVRVPYSGSVAIGYNKLSAAAGKVKVDTTAGRDVLVVDKDEQYAGIML